MNQRYHAKKRLCGVPQGSILRPLLFLIYINDIAYSSTKLKFFLFADDTNLLYANKNLLIKVKDWLISNKLSLNINSEIPRIVQRGYDK